MIAFDILDGGIKGKLPGEDEDETIGGSKESKSGLDKNTANDEDDEEDDNEEQD